MSTMLFTGKVELDFCSMKKCGRYAGLLIALFPISLKALPGEFSDVTSAAGIRHRQYAEDFTTTAEVQVLTGGAAAGDYDGDGWVDLFVTRLDNTDILYRNRGAFRNPDGPWFEDVSEAAGITVHDSTNGAAWGDIDNDGDLDLFVTVIEGPRFYLHVNQGDGTFKEEAVLRNADLESVTDHNGFSVSFGDYDRDGWLDIHICEWGILLTEPEIEKHSVLLRNRGAASPGYFDNVTESAGVTIATPGSEKMYAFTSTFTDLDNDGWLDLAVSADMRTSQLFWNNRDGTFTEGTIQAGINKGSSEMGSAFGDLNRDGLLDWFITCIEDNRFYRNLGGRTFSEEAAARGLQNAGWGWGAQFLDMENDGDLDLIMTNGYHPYETSIEFYYMFGGVRDLMHLWRNDEGVLTDVSGSFGITDAGEGKGLLLFDYDRDGDEDVFVANTGEPPILYRNDIHSGNAWLRLELKGTKSNSQGIGAKVKVISVEGEEPRYFELSGASNYISQNEAKIHVGLGALEEPVHSIQINWPSGTFQLLQDVPINQTLTIAEPERFEYSDWVRSQFDEEYLDDPLVVGLEIDGDGDGFTNLQEYAFGFDPQEYNTESPMALEKDSGTGGDNIFRFAHPRAKAGDDLVFYREYSENLHTWSPLVVMEETILPGMDSDVARLRFSKSGSFFLRLRISLLP